MRQVTRKGLMTMAAASGVLAAAGGYAHADSGAQGSATNSPGVLSGNNVQAPVEAEVNVCGNTVSVVGLLNPASGNKCSNGVKTGKHAGGSGSSYGGSRAQGHASDSPGVASGNHVQAPVHVPVNACGNSVNVVGVGNPATGNECSNGGGGHHGSSHGGGSRAEGHTGNSPGVGSGNLVQAPVHVPVNACGNSVSVIGLGNGTTGNDCGNPGGGGSHENPGGPQNPPVEQPGPEQPGNPGDPETPGGPESPGDPESPGNPGTPGGGTNTPGTQTVAQPGVVGQLAQTGAEVPLGLALSVGAGTLLGGALIYRKARATAR